MINKESMIRKYGSEEAYREFMSEIGRIGGSAKVRKGFAAMPKRKRVAAARKGGRSEKL